MRTLLSTTALLLVAGVLPACSALGLDNLPQADCVRGATDPNDLDAFCASLTTLVPPEDDCHTWQCNEQTRHCEILARDDDQDGAPSMMCAAGATPDCDDADRGNTPNAAELCNLEDDDCDGVIDETVIETTVMSTSLATIGVTNGTAFASQPDSDDSFVLLLGNDGRTRRLLVPSGAAADLTFRDAAGMPLGIQNEGAVTGISAGRYAFVGRFVTAGCQQWSMFSLSSDSGIATLRTGDATLFPACSGPQQISAPALAAFADGTLLATWFPIAEPLEGRACATAPATPVMMTSGRLARTPPSRIGPDVVMLGESVDVRPAAMVALGDAFLVAYPKDDGTVDVHLVTLDPATLAITSHDVVYTEPAGAPGTPRREVGLALGPTDGASTTVALSYYDGCITENPITVRMLTRTGSTVTASATPTTNLGRGPVRTSIQVVWQPRIEQWLVAWRHGVAVTVQSLFREGAPAGAPFDITSPTDMLTYGIEALAAGPLYRAVVVRGTAVSQITFGCGG